MSKTKKNERAEIDRLYEASVWLTKLASETNKAFMPLYGAEERYLVLMGGGGSGKSIFAGRKLLERAVCEGGHRFLICRKVARTLHESCFRQISSQLHDHFPDTVGRINQSDMTIKLKSGSEILFAGLDDVEKLKSIYNITGIWIEEASEISERDFNQLDIRLRGETKYYKQIIITFNPISATHWLKKRFFDRSSPDVLTHKSTYRDNRFLDDEAKAVLEAYRETDEYYYQVYCLGNWGTTGKSVFNSAAVSRRMEIIKPPLREGLFEYSDDGIRLSDIRFIPEKDGAVKIYEEPIEGVPYVIGGDTAGEGSDSFVAQVIDNRNGRQVAVLRHRCDEDIYARQLYCLGRLYNDALVAVETNFSTYPVRELERLRYPRQYVRESIDDYTHAVRRSYGFRTTSATRPVIISGLVAAMREGIENINDRTTLEEMLTFVRGDDLRAAAEAGAHDDCVMALAIAYFARSQQTAEAKLPEADKKSWTADMWEDFNNAAPNERDYLLKKWGSPK